jgi:hypothetical protein
VQIYVSLDVVAVSASIQLFFDDQSGRTVVSPTPLDNKRIPNQDLVRIRTFVLGSFHGLRGTSLVGSAEHGFYSGPLSQRFRQAAKPEDEFRLRLKKLLDPPDGALSF